MLAQAETADKKVQIAQKKRGEEQVARSSLVSFFSVMGFQGAKCYSFVKELDMQCHDFLHITSTNEPLEIEIEIGFVIRVHGTIFLIVLRNIIS